jgi:acylphosphatase
MATVRKRVFYEGTVQGVGFRYTTNGIARHFPVAGTVRNLPDGRVEVVAEGEPADVEAFLDAVLSHWQNHIARVEEATEPPQGLAGFSIRH